MAPGRCRGRDCGRAGPRRGFGTRCGRRVDRHSFSRQPGGNHPFALSRARVEGQRDRYGFCRGALRHRLAKRTASRLAQQDRGSLGGRRMPRICLVEAARSPASPALRPMGRRSEAIQQSWSGRRAATKGQAFGRMPGWCRPPSLWLAGTLRGAGRPRQHHRVLRAPLKTRPWCRCAPSLPPSAASPEQARHGRSSVSASRYPARSASRSRAARPRCGRATRGCAGV
jgi:hypothetical protein